MKCENSLTAKEINLTKAWKQNKVVFLNIKKFIISKNIKLIKKKVSQNKNDPKKFYKRNLMFSLQKFHLIR